MASTVDLLIDARWVIPIAPAHQVLEDHAVVIAQGSIVDLLPTTQARSNYNARQFELSLPTRRRNEPLVVG